MRGKLFGTLSLFLVCALGAAGQKRSITEKDLFAFTWIGDTQLSPDFKSAAFVETTVNAKHEGYETGLFLLDLTKPGSAPRRLTNGPRDTQPRWSPDGSTIAFVRSLEKDGKPQPGQLYLLPLAGGEASPLTKGEKGVSSPHWSPNGAAIAFLMGTEIVSKPKAKSDEVAKPDEHKSDVRIINKAVYRANGEGYLDANEEEQLYLMTLPKAGRTAGDPVQLTSGRFGVNEAVWRPDGKAIYYTSEHMAEPYYTLSHNEIYGVEIPAADAKGVPASVVIAKLPFDASGLALSADGAKFAFRAEEQPAKPRSHQQPDMFVLDIDAAHLQAVTKSPRNLTAAYDSEIGGGVGGDNSAPRGSGRTAPHWSADGTHLIDVVGKGGSAVLVSIDATSGAVTELSQEKQAVQGSRFRAAMPSCWCPRRSTLGTCSRFRSMDRSSRRR